MLSDFVAVDNYNFSGEKITSDSGDILLARFIDFLPLHHTFRSLPFLMSGNILSTLIPISLWIGPLNSCWTISARPISLFLEWILSRFFSCASALLNVSLHQLLQTCALSYLNNQSHDLIFDADSTLIETTDRQEANVVLCQDFGQL